MGFDLFHIDRFLHTGHLIDLSAVVQNGRGIGNRSGVRLEVHNVNFVETEESHKQSNIRLGECVASNEPLLLECFLDFIKCVCQFCNGLVVCSLGLRKSTTVHPVIEAGIHPVVDRIDTLNQGVWTDIEVRILSKGIELGIQHSNNFSRSVANGY